MSALAARISYREAVLAERTLPSKDTAARTHLDIVLGGNANVDFMVPGLRTRLAAEGLSSSVRSTPHGAWIAESFEPDEADFWVVWLSGMGASRGMTERRDIEIGATVAAVQRLLTRGIRVIVVPPEATEAEDDPFSPFVAWRRALIADLVSSLPEAAIVVSVDHIQRQVGSGGWNAARYWQQAKAPCHPDAMTLVGMEIGTVVARSLTPRVRAIAVDLDDTLWGGLVGEVAAEGLELDPDGSGRPFVQMQRFLLDLAERGIPIGVVSKNEAERARRPFTERAEMVLRLDDLVSFDASWEPKYLALRRFADRLNIGIDSVCFLDDSSFERDEASRMLPGLIVPDLPAAPDKRVAALRESGLFVHPVVSDEDRLRQDFFKREEVVEQDLDQYLESLEMVLTASEIGPQTFDRALSLLNKTNQFNLNLWRPSPAELRDVISRPDTYGHVFRLTDRLGDAGVIAVAIAELREGNAQLLAWVMSCRVFSRGVEWAIAAHMADWFHRVGAAAATADFVAGPRNALVTDVLVELGFRADHADAERTTFVADPIRVPPHRITLENP